MPRIPRPQKPKGKKPANSIEPTTPDEFLAAGVAHEEAAEKWRAGDAAKSVRFYQRAIDVYEKGLSLVASSGTGSGRFDLEYNKARILYTITQYPRLQKAYSPELASVLLGAALEAHRKASETARAEYERAQQRAKEDEVESAEAAYADVLFNEAQVLCSLVEAAKEEDSAGEQRRASMATEAAQMFGVCLNLQINRLGRWKAMLAQVQTNNPDEDPQEQSKQDSAEYAQQDDDMDDSEDVGGGNWASVMETPTAKTIVETWVEQMRASTLVYENFPISEPLQMPIDPPNAEQVRVFISEFLQTAPPPDEISVAEWKRENLLLCIDMVVVQSKMQTAIRGEFRYRAKQISAQDYAQEAHKLWQLREWERIFDGSCTWIGNAIDASPERLCSFAENLTDCAATITEVEPGGAAEVRWKLLAHALEALESASKAPGISKGLLARIHQGRGDAEMSRLSAITPSMDIEKVKQTILRNAGVYYRGAAAVARSAMLASFSAADHVDGEVYRSSSIRASVAGALSMGRIDGLADLAGVVTEEEIKQELVRMVDEDLIRHEWLGSIGVNA